MNKDVQLRRDSQLFCEIFKCLAMEKRGAPVERSGYRRKYYEALVFALTFTDIALAIVSSNEKNNPLLSRPLGGLP